jgi:hypothetical protein
MTESSAERRRRKLEALCKEHSIELVAQKADLAPAYLDQIINKRLLPPKQDGTRSPRKLGDAAARKIEESMQLGPFWFDTPETDPNLEKVKEMMAAVQRPISFEAREICKAIDYAEPPLKATERQRIMTQCLAVIARRGKPIVKPAPNPAPAPKRSSSPRANGGSARKPKKSHRPSS